MKYLQIVCQTDKFVLNLNCKIKLPMKTLRCSQIIHIFAFLHAIIVLLCSLLNIADELLLTVATVAMTTILAVRRGQGLGIIAACVIAGNIIGFVIGTYGAELLAGLIPYSALHAVTSFITTEIIGFSFLLIFNYLGEGAHKNRVWLPQTGQLILIIGGLMLIRVIYSRIFGDIITDQAVNQTLKLLLSNSLALITLVCCNVIYQIISARIAWLSSALGYMVGIITETLAIALVVTFIIGYNLPFMAKTPFEDVNFIQIFSISILANLLVYVIVVMIWYLYKTRYRIENEQEKRRLAQFQYNILKQQVNPHFLFNSLNILNGLIEENKNGEACEYVQKLASLYRYMLQNENEHLVRLCEELNFIDQYIDLLKVRFPDCFTIEKNIAPSTHNRYVVQCSLQVLIENAFKHNVVSKAQPLNITISANDEVIIVSNNLQAKSSSSDSTKVGLKNISKQYIAAIGKDLTINKTENKFEVILPLI